MEYNNRSKFRTSQKLVDSLIKTKASQSDISKAAGGAEDRIFSAKELVKGHPKNERWLTIAVE